MKRGGVKFSPVWERMFKNANLPIPLPANQWNWPTAATVGQISVANYDKTRGAK